jgi:Streptomyces sporulation and cell division protein, SsgA
MSSNSSRTAVSAELGLGLVGPEQTIVPLMASLSYSSQDPYAVKIAFHVGTDEPVEWTLARDLLAAALHSREGIGDVQAWPSVVSCDPAAVEGAAAGDTILNIAMTSPFGAARFEVSARAIDEFLQRTYKLVQAGQEPAHLDFDAELTQLLSEALPTRGCRGRAIGPAVGMSGPLNSVFGILFNR